MKLPFLLITFFYISYYFAQPSVNIQAFGNTFNSPVSIKHSGDSKLYIVERSGYIQILNANGSTNNQPFLDIDSKVSNSGNERGLLGLAFHPNYPTTPYFYVNYINNSGNTVVARYTIINETTADNSSELILLTITQTDTNHNGGEMHFGTDGYLYIASGDGGGAGDPFDNGQDLSTLLGKVLRIDVDNTSNGNNYAIPNNNPFANDGDINTLPEIWSYGLRNPWKFSFDKVNGDMWIADVGQSNREEINRVLSSSVGGENFGWRCYEGTATFNTTNCPQMNTITFPVAEYNYGGTPFRCSITGGYRYRGNMYPNFSGLYFFADYCSNEIGYLQENGSNWNINFTTVTSGESWSTFGEDVNGELYIADLDNGQIYKLVDNNLNTPELTLPLFSITPNPSNTHISITLHDPKIKKISIFNIQGRLIKDFPINNEAILNISTQSFSKGLYIVRANTLTRSTSKKLIIH